MSECDCDFRDAIYEAAKWLPRADVNHEWGVWVVESRPDGQAVPWIVCAGPDARLLCDMLAELQATGWKQETEE